MADAIEALVEFLKADAAVAAIAGVRVYGGELPPGEAAHMPRHALVVRASGGASSTGGTFANHDTRRVDVFGFGPTPKLAGNLIDTAALALRRMRRGVWADTLLFGCESAGGASAGREPGTDWPRAFQSFQLRHSLGAE